MWGRCSKRVQEITHNHTLAETEAMPISGHHVGTRRWRWRWRHPPHEGVGMAMALPSFSCLIRCNAVLMLACALMLALHLLLRPHHPIPDPLLHSHSQETHNTRGSAITWSTAGSGVKSPAVVLHNGVLSTCFRPLLQPRFLC